MIFRGTASTCFWPAAGGGACSASSTEEPASICASLDCCPIVGELANIVSLACFEADSFINDCPDSLQPKSNKGNTTIAASLLMGSPPFQADRPAPNK